MLAFATENCEDKIKFNILMVEVVTVEGVGNADIQWKHHAISVADWESSVNNASKYKIFALYFFKNSNTPAHSLPAVKKNKIKTHISGHNFQITTSLSLQHTLCPLLCSINTPKLNNKNNIQGCMSLNFENPTYRSSIFLFKTLILKAGAIFRNCLASYS